jgi:hypothetical protein
LSSELPNHEEATRLLLGKAQEAKPFVDMAFRIDLNSDQGFGGAFVIMPPGDDAKPSVMLMLDDANNPAIFWATLQTRCTLALQELEDKQRKNVGMFGGIR